MNSTNTNSTTETNTAAKTTNTVIIGNRGWFVYTVTCLMAGVNPSNPRSYEHPDHGQLNGKEMNWCNLGELTGHFHGFVTTKMFRWEGLRRWVEVEVTDSVGVIKSTHERLITELQNEMRTIDHPLLGKVQWSSGNAPSGHEEFELWVEGRLVVRVSGTIQSLPAFAGKPEHELREVINFLGYLN